MRRRKNYKRPWGLRCVTEAYDIAEQIGEGVYGKVHKALERDNGKNVVALKKVKTDAASDKEGFPITALREIQILLELQHENIVRLTDVATGGEQSVYLVFEYFEHDLNGLVEHTASGVTEEHYRSYIKQLVAGVAYMHDRGFLHRDIKASNLLVSQGSELKIGDWGLARRFDKDCTQNIHYTNRVITLWYRPPELLLGATTSDAGYGPPADIWSIGCILAELQYGKPILPGQTETEQLDLIFSLLGPPNASLWPDINKLPLYESFCLDPDSSLPQDELEAADDHDAFQDNVSLAQKGEYNISSSPKSDDSIRKRRKVRDRFRKFNKDALDLVDQFLVYDPKARLTAKAALSSAYLSKAKQPSQLPRLKISSAHEWEVKRQRKSSVGNAMPPANGVSVIATNNSRPRSQSGGGRHQHAPRRGD